MATSSELNASVKADIIPLSLEIDDPLIAGYLARFDEADWVEKAVEAMRVGVIALESASPTLDTRVVQQAFIEIEGRLGTQANSFKQDLQNQLIVHFGDENGRKGTAPLRLEKVFNRGGEL